MSNFTREQKSAFLSLASKYNPQVFAIVNRGNDVEINITSTGDAALLEKFSADICTLVIRDFPDYEGGDEDINADAEMLVHMIADILAESDFKI